MSPESKLDLRLARHDDHLADHEARIRELEKGQGNLWVEIGKMKVRLSFLVAVSATIGGVVASGIVTLIIRVIS